VDLGKLAVKFKAEAKGRSAEQFVRDELADVVGQQSSSARKGTDVVLYGFAA
jgi:glyceraldehyde 3-phosphate dehydrogenase